MMKMISIKMTKKICVETEEHRVLREREEEKTILNSLIKEFQEKRRENSEDEENCSKECFSLQSSLDSLLTFILFSLESRNFWPLL